VFQESYSNPQNEVFTKVHEDPLFVMKKEEMRARKEIEENPYKMKLLMKQVEKAMLEQDDNKSEKRSHKKHKKQNRKHKRKGRSPRSSSSESDRYQSSSSSKQKSDKPTLKITTPSLIKSQLEKSSSNKDYKKDTDLSYYGLLDKEGNKLNSSKNLKNLGPDESLYKSRQDLINRQIQLKKRNYHNSSTTSSVKSMSEDEKEKMRKDMENKAVMLDAYKMQKYEEKKNREEEEIIDNHIKHKKDDRLKKHSTQ